MARVSTRKASGHQRKSRLVSKPAVPLGGRRGHSGYEYHDANIAQWYAQALHPEDTGVVLVQTESRGPVDDAQLRFVNMPDRFEQYKEHLGDQRERKEILEDFRDRHLKNADAILAIVTRDSWEELRELVQYATSDAGTLTAFREMIDTNANQKVKKLFETVRDDLFAGDDARAFTFLRHIDVQDSGPSVERIARDTTAHYLRRVVKPAAGTFDLLVRLAQTTGKRGTPLGEEEIRAYLQRRRRRVFSLRSTDRLFLTPAEFRRRVERDVPLGYAGPSVGRDAILDDIVDRLAAGEAVITISGAPGLGKTRLTLDLATRLAGDSRTQDLNVLFVRPDAQPDEGALEQLRPGDKYVLVLDNAHEAEGLFPLLRGALSDPDLATSVQVFITSYPSYGEDIKRALGTATRAVIEIPLAPIEAEDLDALLGGPPYNVADEYLRGQIVRLADGNPLLAQFAVEVARSGGDLSTLHTQDVPSRYLERFTAQIGWTDIEAMHRYLAILAALRCIEVAWKPLRNQVRAVAGLDEVQEERLLRMLQRAGVLRRNARSIRLKPDLLRNHVLDTSFFAVDRRYNYTQVVVAPFLPFKLNDILLAAAEAERRTGDQAATDVLDDALDAIQHIVEAASNGQRLQFIVMLRGIALYRPDDALSVVLPIIEGPEGADDQVMDPFWGPRVITHAHVLQAIVETLKETRYNSLDDSLDALFALATYRPTDQRYEHVRASALALLEETSTFDPFTKPYVVQATVIDHLQTWINEPGGIGVALRLLPRLLTTGFTSGRISPARPMEFTMTSGALPSSPTLTGIYRDAVEIAEALYEKTTSIAERTAIVAAFDQLLAQLWHASVTPELRQTLTDVCSDLVTLLERWAGDASVPLPVLEEMFEWAYRARQLGVLPEPRLNGLLHLPQKNATFNTYLQLMGFPARFRRDKTVEEVQQEQEAWLQQAAAQMTPVILDAWLDMVRRIVDEYSQAHDHLLIGRIQAVMEAAIARDSALGVAMVDHIVAQDDVLRPILAVPLAALRRTDPKSFQSYADRWLTEGRTDLLHHAAQALAWTMPSGGAYSDDHNLLSALVGLNDLSIDLAVVPCLPAMGEQHPVDAVRLARDITERGNPHALAVLAAILPTPHTNQYAGTQVLREVPDVDYLAIVGAMDALDDLDYHAEWCLEQVAGIDPDAVINFFERRIQRESVAGPAFHPIPHTLADSDLVERLRASGRYVEVLRRVRDLTMQGDQLARWRARELFDLLSPRRDLAVGTDEALTDESVALVLREWIKAGESEQLRAVALLLREYAVTDVYLRVARDIIVAARGSQDVESEVLAAMGTITGQMGPLGGTLRNRAEMIQVWETDSNRHVRRFASRLRRALLGHADQSDAATADLLEDNQ